MRRPVKVALINPNLVVQCNDPFTTGIIYMPIGLAYVAASLRARGLEVGVIDAYAERPKQIHLQGEFYIYGLKPEEIADRISQATAVFIYANSLTNHISIVGITQGLKKRHPDLPVVILENTQAVTAYALQPVAQEFYSAGADFILTGEGELRAFRLAQLLAERASPETLRTLDGLGAPDFYTPPLEPITDLNSLPFPAWDLFPLKNYWSIKHAHGPFETDRYLPLLTSRGCPYPCRFCVVPETNRRTWRPRSARSIAEEMQWCAERWGVKEFHLEDLNPTISDKRTRELCDEILRRGLTVTWKIVAGTKVESILNEDTVDRMARAGCRYISISPESGSERILKLMDKPFDLRHAVRMVRKMSRVRIRSQACFVLGFPGETRQERRMSWDLVRELTKVGVDEIALFIITPVPGSAIYKQFHGFRNLSQLNFSPTWRPDYPELSHFRMRLYRNFLLWKLLHHPFKLLCQPWNFLFRRFQTKMEMAPYRAWTATQLGLRARESA